MPQLADAKLLKEGFEMKRSSLSGNPFLLGFDRLERLIECTAQNSGDAYPPCNIEAASQEAL
jgi:hypothetical protein